MIWEYKNMKDMRIYIIMKYMRIYNYERDVYIHINVYIYIYKLKIYIKNKKDASCVLNEIHTSLIWGVNNGNTEV